ncbi:hypothetical protein ABTN81_20120, partial [Acinetobacter baumannii]
DVVANARQQLTAAGAGAEAEAIDREIDTAVLGAIEKAKAAAFPSFDWAMASNYAGTYAPVASRLIDGAVGVFEGGQS